MNSRRIELETSWVRTSARLKNAFGQLPPSPVDGEEGGSVKRYLDFLDQNELELARDELEMLGEANDASSAFWEYLLEAAKEMKLTDRTVRYQKKIAD